MRNRKWKQLMALVLGCVLLFTLLAGCGKQDAGSGQGSASGSGSEAGGSEAGSDSEVMEEDPIKWSGTISVAPYMYGPVENDIVTPLVEEKLLEYGYDVTFENMYLDYGQYHELLNLRLVGEDAPDIFLVKTPIVFQEYAKQGVIATWDEEFFREHAPNVAAFIDAGQPDGKNANFVDLFWAISKYEGKMALIPNYEVNNGSLINMVYNKQWLDKLGAEVPQTLDEFVELMYRFKNEDPDGNGKDDTYGFSDSVINVIFGAYGSFPGFLHMDGEDYGHWYDVDGKLVAADVMPGNEEALKLVKQLYEDGVIDPEFVTGENRGGYWALSHTFMNGRIGVTHTARWTHYEPALYDDEGELLQGEGQCLTEFKAIQGQDAEVVVGPWPEGPDGHIGGFLRLPITVPGATVYNSALEDDPDKLAAIFEIMDLFSTDDELAKLAFWGIEGEHYFPDPATGYKIGNSEKYPDSMASTASGLEALRCVYGPAKPFNYEIYRPRDNAQAVYGREMKAAYPGLADTVGYSTKVWESLPSITEYSGEVHTYRDETWLNMIQGKTELDWDAYVEGWNSRGGQIMTEEANAWYAEHK